MRVHLNFPYKLSHFITKKILIYLLSSSHEKVDLRPGDDLYNRAIYTRKNKTRLT